METGLSVRKEMLGEASPSASPQHLYVVPLNTQWPHCERDKIGLGVVAQSDRKRLIL